MSQPIIEVEHLSKVYGSITAIEDIHFSVAAGEIIGFLGPNGAGKTTTMRILAGYLPATSGTAKIAGYDVHRQSMQVRRHIGYLPETPPLYPEMTVRGFLAFVAKIKGISAGDRRRQVENAMARCQLSDRADTLIRKLSKGYRQRVGIAQAIVHEPPVIILDEPTVGLDPRQIIEVRNLIKSLAGEHTIILSTHILPEASMVCDRVTIINHGKVVTSNTPRDLQAQLESSFGYEVEVGGDVVQIYPLLQSVTGVLEVSNLEPTVAETLGVLKEDMMSEATHIPSCDPTRRGLAFSSTRPERHLLKITCAPDTEPGKDIAAIIIQQDLELYELRRTRPSLEDVFLKLTTEETCDNNDPN